MLSRKTPIGLPPSCPEEPAEGPCAPPHRDRAAARPDRLGPAPGRPGDPAKTIRAPFACALSAAPAAPACATGRHADLDDVFAHQEERPLMADPEEATGELCADEPGCVPAYTTDQADHLRF